MSKLREFLPEIQKERKNVVLEKVIDKYRAFIKKFP